MSRIAYVDGRYVPHLHAQVAMEDRGYQFADGMYEYLTFFNRKVINPDLHFDRFERSMRELEIPQPMPREALRMVMMELIARNGYTDGGIYIQVTRGVARRNHPFPKAPKPVLTLGIYPSKTPAPAAYEHGVKVISHRDIRWKRPDIKSISLLGNIIAKQEAVKVGVAEAWLVNDAGEVTECSHSNCHIVDSKGRLITHPADQQILGGITRTTLLRLARELQIEVIERPYTLEEAKNAAEAFNTSVTANVLPVVQIDDAVIGTGKPGPVSKRLLEAMLEDIYQQTGKIIPTKTEAKAAA